MCAKIRDGCQVIKNNRVFGSIADFMEIFYCFTWEIKILF